MSDTPVPAIVKGDDINERIHVVVFGRDPIPWDEHTRCPVCGSEMRYCGLRSWCHGCNEWQYSPYPDYAGDWSSIRLVEQEIERRGLGEDYTTALIEIREPMLLGLTGIELSAYGIWNLVMRASCEQRCRAAFAVCQQKENET